MNSEPRLLRCMNTGDWFIECDIDEVLARAIAAQAVVEIETDGWTGAFVEWDWMKEVGAGLDEIEAIERILRELSVGTVSI